MNNNNPIFNSTIGGDITSQYQLARTVEKIFEAIAFDAPNICRMRTSPLVCIRPDVRELLAKLLNGFTENSGINFAKKVLIIGGHFRHQHFRGS